MDGRAEGVGSAAAAFEGAVVTFGAGAFGGGGAAAFGAALVSALDILTSFYTNST